MTDGERPLKDKLALQIVRLKIQQIFEECSKFEEKDKKALYEVMGNLLLQRIGAAEPPTPADETPPGLTELTNASPTDHSTARHLRVLRASVLLSAFESFLCDAAGKCAVHQGGTLRRSTPLPATCRPKAPTFPAVGLFPA